MIHATGLTLKVGSKTLFEDLSFVIDNMSRIGLVGANGAGKSTLLKVLARQQGLDAGTVTYTSQSKVAYLPQEVVLASDKTVLQEAFQVHREIVALEQEAQLLQARCQADHTDHAAAIRYAEVQGELAEHHLPSLEKDIKRMLYGLGFSDLLINGPVSALSVGWKMRLVLAKLLLEKADFYLFDEPTNHLDIVSKEWFLRFIQQAPFGFMIVSHERYFLDHACTKILELEHGKGTMYTGNYTAYVEKKAQNLEVLVQAYKNQQQEIERKQRLIDRFRASASKAKFAQSLIKELDKMELIELPPSLRTMTVPFGTVAKPARRVLDVRDVSQQFGDKKVFEHISFEIERGDKVALVAANGVGKTTLFNVIAGRYPRQSGAVTFGENVTYAIFDQDQNRALTATNTILEEVELSGAHGGEQRMRTFLGAFLFSGTDVHKKIKVLSGGEKNRVAMVKVLLQDANLLLLDEPTNHLDMSSKEQLLRALQEYPGTVLFVSHDHDFINRLATRIIELTPTRALCYHGNYEAYRAQKEYAQQTTGPALKSEPSEQAQVQESFGKNRYERDKEIKKLERMLEKVEGEIGDLKRTFERLSYGTPAFEQAQQQLKTLEERYALCMAQWEELHGH